MRLDIQSAVALRHRDQRAFGTARWIEGARVAFTTYGDIVAGERMEMRLELTGAYDTIWAEVLIQTVRPVGLGGPQLCTGDIVHIPETDRDKLDNWVEERSVSQVSLAGGEAVAPSTARTQTSSVSERGRTSIGDALRRSLEARSTGERLPRNRAAFELSRDGSLLSAAWTSWQALAQDWSQQLGQGVLRVDTALRCPPPGYELTVRLCLPDGQVLAVRGRVRGSDDNGMVLELDLPYAARRKLSRSSTWF